MTKPRGFNTVALGQSTLTAVLLWAVLGKFSRTWDGEIPVIVISGVINVSNETRDECIACLAELRRVTLAEGNGVVSYRVGLGIENPNEIHVYEEWESTEALKEHCQIPCMNAFRDLRKKYGLATTGFSRWRAEELGEF